MSNKNRQCECCDRGCNGNHPVACEHGRCQTTARLKTIKRVDMEDRTGTRMCPACVEDALQSGLFV